MTKRKLGIRIALNVFAWLVGLVWILPVIGILMTAIRPFDEVINGWWHFEEFTPTFSNFFKALNHPTAPLFVGLKNSIIIALPATILPLFIATLAGYGLSRYNFPLRKGFIIAVVLTLTLPQQMIAVPIFQMMSDLGLVDSYLGLILLHTAWGTPWITFFMRNYFKTMPISIEEAARIDGASDFQIFYRVVLPNIFPAVASASALQFTWVWSDFFLALILIYSPDKLLMTQRVPLMRGVYHVDWGLLSAASIMVMIVPILIYLLLQRYYVKGMVGWTIK
ncbi:carbohydrate ABC transporter permease [Kosmotoga pacifica]|uniref:ABC transporter permease n=1 Tax=Kosmotoga pacifica TaxID=1330330 RepID=A0A0G2ZEY4_9BACT|nr:carbohydrate ABC transporter permease [Kosmotoga pacifica]AKI98109.1 ABC transporter permease [Kosmotoga pacifica]